MIMMSMQFLGKANSMFRLWFVIGNFLCTIDSTVEVESSRMLSYDLCEVVSDIEVVAAESDNYLYT